MLNKYLRSFLISVSVLIIMEAGITPVFGYGIELMEKMELTVYEQYLKDYIEHFEKIYTPEKYFPQKEMEIVTSVHFNILPDGSIIVTDVRNPSVYYSNGDPFWMFHIVYYNRLKRLSQKHGQYVKELLESDHAAPFPEPFGENISVAFKLRHWNNWFRKPIFRTTIKCIDYSIKEGPEYGNKPKLHMFARIFRSNYTSGK